MTKTISADKTPNIIVDIIGGDLSVVGWDGDFLIKGDEEDYRVEEKDGDVLLSCDGDLSLRVPKGASFQITKIGGDASMRSVRGGIQLSEIGGDLSIRDAGSVSIDLIHADFSLRGSTGDLFVKNAHGDVSVRDVGGNINLESVADDLAVRGVRGNVKVNVGEDVIVYLDPKSDGSYSVVAGDDILLVLPADANATLSIQGDRIDIDLPGVEDDKDATERSIVLGDGSAAISLSAGGDVRVSDKEDAGRFAQDFGNFAGLNFDWSDFGERVADQMERAAEQVARQAERAARRAEAAGRRAERHAERHVRKWRGKVNAGRWNWEISPTGVIKPPAPPSEPVAEEERMAILKMLQEKKISASQADDL
ncbi:MAG: hypothetical protein R3307_06880, partial [Anaerolineales bacterium]|nr:hypothetical protein [Anaerolineales bacterium]